MSTSPPTVTIIKLHSKNRLQILPNSMPAILVNEAVKIPDDAYGKFFLRKTWVRKDLNAPDLPFHPNWQSDHVEVYLQSRSLGIVEIGQGEEIGELWIFGGFKWLNYPF